MKRLDQRRYRCVHCGFTGYKRSDKQWIQAYCSKIGRDVHMVRDGNNKREIVSEAE